MTRLLWRVVSLWIRRSIPTDKADPILGDLVEDLRERRRVGGKVAAAIWLLRECRSMTAAYGTPERDAPASSVNVSDSLTGIWHDLIYSARLLRRHKGFAVTAVLTLALGVGANIAVFSAVRAVLLSDLPYPAARELTYITLNTEGGNTGVSLTPATVAALEAQADLFQVVGASVSTQPAALGGDSSTAAVHRRDVSAGFSRLSALPPVLGRHLEPGDYTPGTDVVVIAERLWRTHLGASPDIIGSTVVLDGLAARVVGVVPDGFDVLGYADRDRAPTVWQPLVWTAEDLDPASGNFMLTVVARLVPGSSVTDAQQILDGRSAIWPIGTPTQRIRSVTMEPLHERETGSIRAGLWLVQAVAILLLLIACSNLANLFLAHGVTRRHEMGVRVALGAGRGRVFRQLITEIALVAVTGGIVGVGLASIVVPLLVTSASWTLPRPEMVSVGFVELLAGLGLGFATLLLAGTGPAWMASTGNVRGRVAAPGRSQRMLRSALVASQVVLTVVLLVSAGLLVRSFVRLVSLPLGFDPAGLVLAELRLPRDYMEPGRRAALAEQVQRALASKFGEARATVGDDLPFSGTTEWGFQLIGPDDSRHTGRAIARRISPHFMDVLRQPVSRGRNILPSDLAGDAAVALVNEQFERTWGQGDVLGRQLLASGRRLTIVGIVGDSQFRNVVTPEAAVYLMDDRRSASLTLAVRSDRPGTAGDEIAEVIRAIDTRIALTRAHTVDERLAGMQTQRRFYLAMFSLFGTLGLVLAAIGVYSVVSHTTRQRSREAGIRMALGARAGQVTRLMLRQGLHPVAAGLLLGVTAAWWITGALQAHPTFGAQLFHTTAHDPLTFGATIAGVLAVAIVASWIPAARASRVDPASVLKAE
jgi:putative ABC transport system permease protein